MYVFITKYIYMYPYMQVARSILKLPLEILVGERSTVNKDITQIVEVHDEDDKFLRLLQLLGMIVCILICMCMYRCKCIGKCI